ncbi:MAG TPA: DUF3618 domain-containing protein [Longimicrobium sp.]|jgi:hypothetical protein
MSDIRVTPEGGADPDRTLISTSNHAGESLPAGHALPGTAPLRGDSPVQVTGDTPAGTTNDADATRAEIEQTRARMSETIDTIEEALLRKKGQIEEKLDVKAQVRERLSPVTDRVNRQPLAIFGGVFGAGLVLGYITGDGDDKPRASKRSARLTAEAGDEYGSDWKGRSRRWEEQARRLMKQNQEQEEELHRLRSRLEESERRPARASAGYEAAAAESESTDWRGSLFGAISGVFGGLMNQVRGRDEGEYEVTLDDAAGSSAEYDGSYSPSRSYESQAYTRRGYGQGTHDSSEYGSGDYPQSGFQQGGRPYDDGLGGSRGYGSDELGYGPDYDRGQGGYGGGYGGSGSGGYSR